MALLDRITTFAKQAKTAATLARFAFQARPVRGSDPLGRAQHTTWLPHDARQQEVLRSEEAKYGRVTYFSGESPSNIPYYPGSGLDPRKIGEIHVEVDTTGRMIQKADLDYQVLRRDSHLAGVDEARRVALSGRRVRIEASDPSDLALACRDIGEAVFDGIDAFDDAVYGLGLANGCGYASAEAIYSPRPIRVPGIGARIPGAWPRSLEPVHNRNFRFHPVADVPVLEQSPGKFCDLDDPPYKFIMHYATGDGPRRQRGHLYRTIWPHLIKHEAIIRWAHCLDFYGIPTPWAELDETLFQNAELKAQVLEQLQNQGLGNPFIKLRDYPFGVTETPTGLDARGMHGALIGWCNSEQSKCVQHETLTTEMGGVGGYNTADIHQNTKEARIRQDERGMRATMRAFLREVFILNMPAICAALSPLVPGGVRPDDVLCHLPRIYWLVELDLTPDVQLDMMLAGVEAGMEIDARQAYLQFGWDRARRPGDRIRGKAVEVADGALVVGEVEAARGLDNPKEIDPAQSAGTSQERAARSGAALDLTATAQSAIVKVNEARAEYGLPPLQGPDGEKTIAELLAGKSDTIAQAAHAEAGGDRAQAQSARERLSKRIAERRAKHGTPVR